MISRPPARTRSRRSCSAVPAGRTVSATRDFPGASSRRQDARRRPVALEADGGGREAGGDGHADPRAAPRHAQAHRRVEIRPLGRPDLLDRIPELAPGLCLAGLKMREVGLVVGKYARHEFDVRAVLVGQVAVPRVAELVVAPGPLLLARGKVVIGDVHEARLPGVIVAAEEVLARPQRHVRGGHGNIRVPGKVMGGPARRRNELPGNLAGWDAVARPPGIVHPVVAAAAERKGAHRALGVIGDGADVRRKERLVVLVHPRHATLAHQRKVCGYGGPVVDPGLHLPGRPCRDAGRPRACPSSGSSAHVRSARPSAPRRRAARSGRRRA